MKTIVEKITPTINGNFCHTLTTSVEREIAGIKVSSEIKCTLFLKQELPVGTEFDASKGFTLRQRENSLPELVMTF